MDRRAMRRRMAQHPNAVSLDEARRVLEAYGWVLDRVRGSHHIFARGSRTVSIPSRRPHILSVYVKRVLSATEADDEPRTNA
jgi:predicted RNA binding protein YcfA (HicA-like mRNA interferase family)